MPADVIGRIQKVEHRTFVVDELRIDDAQVGQPIRIRGHAAVFNKLSRVMQGWEGPFQERIRPGAFARTLRENPDVVAFVQHDPSKILGRTTAGTLELKEDKEGLAVTITPPPTTFGQDIVASINRGDVDSMSFGFETVREEFTKTDGNAPDIRELIDLDLFEVSAVVFEAYPDTSIAVRSHKVWRGNAAARAKLEQQRADIAKLESDG